VDVIIKINDFIIILIGKQNINNSTNIMWQSNKIVLYALAYKPHNCENQMLMCRHSTWTIANTAWFTLLSCYEEQPSWMLHYWSQCARNVSYKLRVPLSSIQIGYVPFVFSQFVDALNTKVKFTVPCAPPRRDPTQHSYNKTRCALSPGVSVSRTAAPSALNSYHAAGCEGRCASSNKSYFFTHSTFSKYCGMNYVTS